jgi:hypothetical protein
MAWLFGSARLTSRFESNRCRPYPYPNSCERHPASAPSLSLCQSLLSMFFWHPHSTFDFWSHHSKHKHHDRPTPPLGADSDGSPSHEVFLEPAENPQELTLVRRWLAVICISTASICVTCASSMVRASLFCFRDFFPQIRCLTVALDRRRSWRCL